MRLHCGTVAAPPAAAAPTSTWLASVALVVVTCTSKLVAGALSARSLYTNRETQVEKQAGQRGCMAHASSSKG